MRNFTIYAILAAMTIPAAASAAESSIKSDGFRGLCQAMADVVKGGRDMASGDIRSMRKSAVKTDGMFRMSELAKKLKPGTVKTYGWWQDNWMPENTYAYTYDAAGNVVVELSEDEDGYFSKTVSEYNDNGKVTFQESKTSADGIEFENNRKTEFEYDPILTDVITKRSEWIWLEEEWQLVGNNYERRITRDDAGNITSVVIAVLYNGEYDPTQRLLITYGENGEAVEIAEQILDYDGKDFFWEDGAKVTDIVWERTDGQIYDIEEIFGGSNRVKSCRMEEADGLVLDVTFDYADDSDNYMGDISMTLDGMTVKGTLEYTTLENGGERMHLEMMFMGMVIMSVSEEVRYDDWGLLTLQSVEEGGFGELFKEGTLGEVEYDAEGKPATYTVSQYYTDDDTGEEVSEYIIRAEYSDYRDVTASAGELNAVSDAPVRYYNLQGVQVEMPAAGSIVIRCQGDKASKIRY